MWQKFWSFLFGEKIDGDLPARVQEDITAQQFASERLIGWVQLALVVIFGSLYALTPPPTDKTTLMLEPWALGLYFTFTLLRLRCAYRQYMPHWLLVTSVVMDIGLLMALIWSFHIKYGQPPTFYLKAPTMIYVFIFIALRALRFEPKYILITGGVSVIGWIILMTYAITGTPGDPMITRNYVTYLTSNSILVGAEIDKIISIIIVTLVLAAAVLRAQRTFYQAALDHSAAEDLSRFVSAAVADRITSADRAIQPGDGETRIASCIFTDIEGFSTVSEKLTSSELAQTLNDYFYAVGEIIDKHGGVITQYQGDLILITFNAVTADEDHAANAVRTAMEIKTLCENQTFGPGKHWLLTRCGVNTGSFAVGAIGTESRLAFTIHGDEVNIAARLEQLNKEFGTYILCGENTASACTELCSFRPVTEMAVRGRTKPTRVLTPVD